MKSTSKPLKILHIIGSMDSSQGGTSQGIRNSIPALTKMGVQNEVASLDYPNATFLTTDSFQTHALGPAKGPWGYGSKLMPWLETNLNRFDLVVVHGLWQYYGYVAHKAITAHKRKGSDNIKLFVMPHGMLDPYFQKAPGRKLKAVRNWFYWKFIERNLINNCDGLLFTCEAELLLARKTFRPYRPKSEFNVGFGIETPPVEQKAMQDAFYDKCEGLPRYRPYLLFLSRIHEKKGVDLLIEAYSKLYEVDFPNLVIAGPGLEGEYGRKIQNMLADNGHIKDAVFFPGMLTGKAKWGAFYGCEAFLLPSHQENFGIAVVEALACGKPVLISNQVNIYAEIEKMQSGLVANDNIEGTMSLLAQWHTIGESQKNKIGSNALKTFKKYYEISQAAEVLLKTLSRHRS